MSLELDEGVLYTVKVRRHSKISSMQEVSFSDLEFVQADHFGDEETVTFIDLEYVGLGFFEWTTEPSPVFLDRSGLFKGQGLRYRMFRESEVIAAEPTLAG